MPATPPIEVGADVLRDPLRASRLEWLLGDGRGGYAASTPLGLHTRREHALLAVAADPAPLRLSLLARVEEAVEWPGGRLELSTNAYRGALHPRGLDHAVRFALDPLPTLTWEVPGGRLSRTVARLHHRPAALVAYRLEGERPLALEVRPLLSYREPHGLQRENGALRAGVARLAGDVVADPYESCPPLHLRMAGAEFRDGGAWYRGFEYARDAEAGREHHEDLWSPGAFRVGLQPGGMATLVAWAGPIAFGIDPAALMADARRRLRALANGLEGVGAHLHRAADAFVVAREAGRVTVLTRFPELGETPGEAAAALPGILVATGRHEEARVALREVARGLRAAPGQADLADSVLWAALAAERYREATRDVAFLAGHVLEPLAAAIDSIRAGQWECLRLRGDALLDVRGRALLREADPDGEAPVEAQALWANALVALADVAREAGHGPRAGEWSALAHRARDTVSRVFWSESHGFLADRLRGEDPDRSLRPAQVMAIALPHALVARERAVRVLQSVRRGLATPLGLRDRPPAAAAAAGGREGGEASDGFRAWPALGASYHEALIRVHGEEAKAEAWRFLDAIGLVLATVGLGTVPEAVTVRAPHQAEGSPAHAWSVGEVLRLVVRLGRRPVHRPLPRE